MLFHIRYNFDTINMVRDRCLRTQAAAAAAAAAAVQSSTEALKDMKKNGFALRVPHSGQMMHNDHFRLLQQLDYREKSTS